MSAGEHKKLACTLLEYQHIKKGKWQVRRCTYLEKMHPCKGIVLVNDAISPVRMAMLIRAIRRVQ